MKHQILDAPAISKVITKYSWIEDRIVTFMSEIAERVEDGRNKRELISLLKYATVILGDMRDGK